MITGPRKSRKAMQIESKTMQSKTMQSKTMQSIRNETHPMRDENVSVDDPWNPDWEEPWNPDWEHESFNPDFEKSKKKTKWQKNYPVVRKERFISMCEWTETCSVDATEMNGSVTPERPKRIRRMTNNSTVMSFCSELELHFGIEETGVIIPFQESRVQNKKKDDCTQKTMSFEERLDSLLPKFVCGVCSGIKAESDMKKTPVSQSDSLFSPLLRGHETNPLLCDAAIKDGHVSVCKNCGDKLRQGQLPSKSLANLDWGVVPPELACLSYMEEKMIALYNCNSTIVVLPGGQTGRLGGVAYVQNDLVETVQRLPRLPKETDTVFAIPPNRPFDKKMYEKRFEVRPYMVKKALAWLVANNPLYKEANENNKIDYKRLEQLALSYSADDPWNPDFDQELANDSLNPDFDNCNNADCRLQIAELDRGAHS